MNAEVQFRNASSGDVATIVGLLADDPLGAKREHFALPLPRCYYDAFTSIHDDANNELVVVTLEDEVVGVLQLTFVPSLTYQGGWRAQIEGVRVKSELRSKGLGQEMLQWAIKRARERSCHMVQLTTDKQRPNARRFYEDLGFNASHEGMKFRLDTTRHR